MREGWRERITAAIEDSKRSYRDISMAAKLGPAYVSEMLRGKEPTVGNLQKICEALGVSFSYIVTGVNVTPDGERFLGIYSRLSDEDRQALLRLSRAMQTAEGDTEEPPPLAQQAEQAPARLKR